MTCQGKVETTDFRLGMWYLTDSLFYEEKYIMLKIIAAEYTRKHVNGSEGVNNKYC